MAGQQNGGFGLIARDKALHAIGGAVIALAAGALATPMVGLMAAVAVGAAKEAWDASGRGTVDLMDFVATAGGGVAGYVTLGGAA